MSHRPELILETLEPYRRDLMEIAVESTFNWYWLVVLLIDEGYGVHRTNPSSSKKYEGLKHSDDNHDAFWLAAPIKGSLKNNFPF